MKRSGVDRLLYVGGCGSLYVREGVMLIDDPRALAKGLSKGRPEGHLPTASGQRRRRRPRFDVPLGSRMAFYLFERERGLDWTYLSPSGFPGDSGGPSGAIRWGRDRLLLEADGTPSQLDVADLAIALVDEAEQHRHPRGRFTVACPRRTPPVPATVGGDQAD